jgi:hypothetical protein
VSTDDQKLSAVIFGEALLLARDHVPQELLDRLAEVTAGREDLRTEVAGTMAGTWFATLDGHQGAELIGTGLLLLAGYVDGDQLKETVRVAYDRAKGSPEGYGPTGGRPRGLFCSGQLARGKERPVSTAIVSNELEHHMFPVVRYAQIGGVRPDLPRWQAQTARCVTAQALFARSGSGIFLLLSRSSHTKGRSSVSFSSGDTAPEPKYRTT